MNSPPFRRAANFGFHKYFWGHNNHLPGILRFRPRSKEKCCANVGNASAPSHLHGVSQCSSDQNAISARSVEVARSRIQVTLQQVSTNYCSTFLFTTIWTRFSNSHKFSRNKLNRFLVQHGKVNRFNGLGFMDQTVVFFHHRIFPFPKFISDFIQRDCGCLQDLPRIHGHDIISLKATHFNNPFILGITDQEQVIFQPFFFPLKPLDISPTNFPKRFRGGNNIQQVL